MYHVMPCEPKAIFLFVWTNKVVLYCIVIHSLSNGKRQSRCVLGTGFCQCQTQPKADV
uniref:Uncharacterized protein n=1 Tax=Anguilla anguilla TaxID=7936 RepID=A0A0E9UZD5_ANGAN